ncbi:hypothetical protein [Acanthopleuribacter pedis]|uniref:Gingipain domain-containing protein n=1 Tax=Acanthopleuribacter pedis TaxID=442870 RepID=A0A8J7U2Y6_9BACT|nr:hypothetical protein [Acanthopleuribacter pedis]MBO1317773.1 hypothetical protein [Acanthopleuribacter pedis]
MSESTIYRLGLFPGGRPAFEPISPAGLTAALTGQDPSAEDLALKQYTAGRKKTYLNVIHGVEPKNLASAGWGLVLPRDSDDGLLDALAPLIEHRRRQAGDRFYQITGEEGLAPRESKAAFLRRHFMGAGPVDPEKLPYYLLLVGSPEQIPFHFQQQLDVQFAVGRLHFDRLADYAAYARQVVETETRAAAAETQAVALWCPTHDAATIAGYDLFLDPLSKVLAKKNNINLRDMRGAAATKAAFQALAGGADPASLLVSLSHGMAAEETITADRPDARAAQGALVCGDWRGGDAPWSDAYVLGPDSVQPAPNSGTIWFNLSCFGGGTPKIQPHFKAGRRRNIADEAFVNALSQKLLSRERGALQAVVSHVDLLYLHSFEGNHGGSYPAAFTSAVSALLDGFPVGAAVDVVNQRYAELATELTDHLEELHWADEGTPVDPEKAAAIAETWCAHHDARNYVVFGDPAVRLGPVPATT